MKKEIQELSRNRRKYKHRAMCYEIMQDIVGIFMHDIWLSCVFHLLRKDFE